MQQEGRWDRIRGRIRLVWGNLTDDDVQQARGDLERLVGIIKERTGESAEAVRQRLQQLMQDEEGQQQQ
ncbi:MAG: CsbD family protein [Dehalococcoidia bacterium]|nr:CsbD family protein [Dehalococcoidia bacterium]MDW8009594.1 CsbD family protein [Chloroflexota bacterium]